MEQAKEGEDYVQRAGKIAWKALRYGATLVAEGVRLVDVAEAVEECVRKEGAEPAFPVNISCNNDAAHFTPSLHETRTFTSHDVVKLDCGAHIDGWIGDCAITIDLSGEQGKLIEAADAALDAAIALMRPGVEVTTIATVIEEEIRKRGCTPVENLSGHQLRPYVLHGGVSIPNVKRKVPYILKEGDVFAIEPFVTRGSGTVRDGERIEIFSYVAQKPVRLRDSRRVLSMVAQRFPKLPFAQRWIEKEIGAEVRVEHALHELVRSGAVRPYAVLRDTGIVVQAEKTVLITADGAIVTTRE